MGTAQRARTRRPTPKAQKAALMASASSCHSAGAMEEMMVQSQMYRSESHQQPPRTNGDSESLSRAYQWL